MFTQAYTGDTEVVVVGIAPGEMLLETITAAVKAHDVQNGAVVSGIGTLKVARMHHIEHDRFPPDDRIFTVEKPLEVASISGIIADGTPHLHMTVGYRDEWSIAGHLEPGCEVLYLAEVVILKFNGLELDRHYDAARKISLLGPKA
jgi:predicted DNA-binding protein with PD1-like motif